MKQGLQAQKRTALLVSLTLLLMLAGVVQYVARLDAHNQLAYQAALVNAKAAVLRNHIEYEINTTLNLTMGSLVFVATHPEITQQEFEGVAHEILKRSDSISNIALARNNVISQIYPLQGNEAALGLDYMATPSQRAAVLRAIESGKTTIAGPVKLVQGGEGFISRIPIFLDGERERYWGVTSIVVMTDKFYQKSGLYDAATEMDIALRGKDAMGMQGEVFFGNESLFDMANSVLLTINLPEGSWILAAAPKGGWSLNSGRMALIYFIGGALALLIASLTYFLWLKNIDLREEERKVISASEHKNRFFTQMTHELRTPLTAIHGSIRMLNSGRIDVSRPESQELLRNAERNSQRLLWLVNDVLDMKKLESGKMEYNLGPRVMQDLIVAAIDKVKPYAAPYDISILFVDEVGQTVTINADDMRIEQVLINLLSNAIKHSPEGSEVVLTLKADEDNAHVYVADKGPGIDPQMLATIFSEFSRSDAVEGERRIYASTGLGLSISRQLIDGQGGQIDCHNAPDGGAVFHFSLPLAGVPKTSSKA